MKTPTPRSASGPMNVQPEQAYGVCQSVPAARCGDSPASTLSNKSKVPKAAAADTEKADLSRRKSLTTQRAKLAKRKRLSGDKSS
jgi:hypothetical protein